MAPSWKQLKLVIESAGGKVENKRRKDVEEIKELNKAGQDPKYIIVTCHHDLHIVADVLIAKIGIYNAEFIMSAVMTGRMDYDLTKSITTVRWWIRVGGTDNTNQKTQGSTKNPQSPSLVETIKIKPPSPQIVSPQNKYLSDTCVLQDNLCFSFEWI